MSYLENIKKDGKYANPFFCLMGIDVISIEPGRAELPFGVVGALFVWADWTTRFKTEG